MTAPPAHVLLRLLVALQERGHRVSAERLHDGPMQDFTAILLDLASVRRRLPDELADRVNTIENRLRATTVGLHQPPSPFRLDHDARRTLTTGLSQRVDGLLVDHLDTDLRFDDGEPTGGEIAVALAAVQLLLMASDPVGTGERARVSARCGPDGLDLLLSVQPSRHEPPADAARAGRLRPLADLIGAELRHDPDTGAWKAALTLERPRAAEPAAGIPPPAVR
ncbi:histidine kinase [Frankia sp. AgB32]|uniref:histidine kinase n=1 Tax=Frankia sp. AgB32 TaxID=631119 RepID=UPI00200FAA52|nr:histidine kinase [Frankia sp. AgB32]MCK9897634.1 histidine kinase [Frankia sp. AgB32]